MRGGIRRVSAAGNDTGGSGVNCFDNPERTKYKSTVKTETKEAVLTRKIPAALAAVAVLLALCLPAAAGPDGSLKGRIVDDKGAPLSGAYLYVTSPTAIGVANYITSKSGRYAISGLVPGSYKVVAEMPGFKTVTVEGVALSSGMTVSLDFRMQPTEIEEEPTTERPGPTLDRDSARTTVVLDKDLITRLPLARDFTALLSLVPGLVFENDKPGMRASLQGAPVTANVLVEDGVIVTHPVDARAFGPINVDIIDEVVVETAGHPVEAGPAQGAYVNILHHPGAGATLGSLSYGVSGKGLVDSLWKEDEIAEMDGAEPLSLKREHDLSLTYGAPLLEDMAWLFANVRYRTLGYRAPYRYWTDPTGGRNFVFDFANRDLSGLFKMQMNLLNMFKGVLEFGFSKVDQPVSEAEVDDLRPEAATRALDGEHLFRARFGGSYAVNQGTRIDLSLGYAKYAQPLILSDLGTSKPEYYDVITGRRWGSGSVNDREKANRMRAGASVTRFQDGFLGMFHEIVLGGDYETTYTTSETWKADNLIYNYAGGSPYTYGTTVSPISGEEVGWGLIGFYIAPAAGDTMTLKRELKRIGAYAQDTIKIGGRISLSGGLRFDRSDARFASVSKGSSGNTVSTTVGSTLIDPLMGYNIYSTVSLGAWEKAIVWNTLSPRVGLAIDLFGSGRTVLKGSWARLPEYLGLGYSQDLSPVDPLASHDFVWYDEDGDGLVDTSRHLRARLLRLPHLQERVFPAGRRPRPHRPRHRGVDGGPGTAGRPRLHPLRPLHRAALDEQHRARRLRPLDRGPLVAARRSSGRLVGPLFDRRAGRGRIRRRPGDRLSPLDHGPRVLRAHRERARAHGQVPERRVRLPQEVLAQLAAVRVPGLEPGHGNDDHGLPLERRQLPGPADAERLHQHLRQRRPPPGPSVRRPPGGDGPLRRGLLRQRPPQGPERHALGPHGDDHPADGLGRGPRGHHDARHRLSGEPRLTTVRLVEDPGPEDREGVRQGRSRPLRRLGRRLQPARRQIPDARPQ